MWYLEKTPNKGVLAMDLINEGDFTNSPTMGVLATNNGVETNQVIAAHPNCPSTMGGHNFLFFF